MITEPNKFTCTQCFSQSRDALKTGNFYVIFSDHTKTITKTNFSFRKNQKSYFSTKTIETNCFHNKRRFCEECTTKIQLLKIIPFPSYEHQLRYYHGSVL